MASNENDKILVHQALHGYDDGHRLLKASRSFDIEVERIMLFLSDMSGPSMVHGFEEYLTGYPIDKIGAYALARTWHAPEMDRPGCVWTHTLVIENVDLARIKNLRILLSLFLRPQKECPFSLYKSPLIVPKITELAPESKIEDSSLAILTLDALYETPGKTVIIPSVKSDIYENLALAIWSQQWPRLRRAFWFCTGSISNRVINGHTFDLQIVPKKLTNHIIHGSPTDNFAIVEIKNYLKYQNDRPEWLSAANKDLLENKGTLLRSFLWKFGAESPSGRAMFADLVKTFLAIQSYQKEEKGLKQIIELVSKSFPSAKDLSGLKKAIFGDAEYRQEKLFLKFDEEELLRELSITNHYKSFDSVALDLFERAKKLAKKNTKKAITLVQDMPVAQLNSLQEIILQGLIRGLAFTDVVSLSENRPEILSTILKNNPDWATTSDVWKLPAEKQNTVWKTIVANIELDQEDLNGIVSSMINVGSDEIARDVLYRYEDRAIKAVLAWLDSQCIDIHCRLPGRWLDVMRSETSLLLRRLEESPEASIGAKAIISQVLNPNSKKVCRLGPDIWLPLAKKVNPKKGVKPPDRTLVFLLALGFNNPGTRADELVACSFEAVHDMAGVDRLGYDYWRHLSEHVTSFWSWGYWDKCRLLRETLVDKFITYEWPIKSFLKSARNTDTFSRIVKYCQESWRRREFLQKVAREAHKHKTLATKAQSEILSRII